MSRLDFTAFEFEVNSQDWNTQTEYPRTKWTIHRSTKRLEYQYFSVKTKPVHRPMRSYKRRIPMHSSLFPLPLIVMFWSAPHPPFFVAFIPIMFFSKFNELELLISHYFHTMHLLLFEEMLSMCVCVCVCYSPSVSVFVFEKALSILCLLWTRQNIVFTTLV